MARRPERTKRYGRCFCIRARELAGVSPLWSPGSSKVVLANRRDIKVRLRIGNLRAGTTKRHPTQMRLSERSRGGAGDDRTRKLASCLHASMVRWRVGERFEGPKARSLSSSARSPPALLVGDTPLGRAPGYHGTVAQPKVSATVRCTPSSLSVTQLV